MDEDPSEVLIVFFHAVVELFDIRLGQKTQHLFLKLALAFAGDNFHRSDPFLHGFRHHPVQFRFDFIAFIKNVVQV